MKMRTGLLALAGLSLVLTGCGGQSNTPVTNPDGTKQETTTTTVSLVQINSTEKVVCIQSYSALSCDWDNKIDSP